MQLGDTQIRDNSLLVCLRGAIVTTGMTGAGGRIDTVANIVRGLGYGIVARRTIRASRTTTSHG